MSNTPRPPQQRAERMKVLEEEVDQLQRVEEVLVTREGGERSTAGDRRARRSRRVTPDQQRGLRLARPLSPTADIPSRTSWPLSGRAANGVVYSARAVTRCAPTR